MSNLNIPLTKRHIDLGALYSALDSKRKSEGMTEREVESKLRLSPNTFSDLQKGNKPDVDTFITLTIWLGVEAERFAVGQALSNSSWGDKLKRNSRSLKTLENIHKKGNKPIEEAIRASYRHFGKGTRRAHQLGEDLRTFLYTKGKVGGQKYLDHIGSGWLDGGCVVYADAVCEWIGGQAEMIGIASKNGRLEHVAVMVGYYFLDGDGVSTLNELLDRWENDEGLEAPRLVEVNSAKIKKAAIPRDELRSKLLGEELNLYFPRELAWSILAKSPNPSLGREPEG